MLTIILAFCLVLPLNGMQHPNNGVNRYQPESYFTETLERANIAGSCASFCLATAVANELSPYFVASGVTNYFSAIIGPEHQKSNIGLIGTNIGVGALNAICFGSALIHGNIIWTTYFGLKTSINVVNSAYRIYKIFY